MTKQIKTNVIKKKLIVWLGIVVGVLMIPFLTKAPWTLGDFVFAGVVLFSLATIYEFATRHMTNPKHKLLAALAVLATIGLIMAWAATGPD